MLALHFGVQTWILHSLFCSLSQSHVYFEDLLILHWHLRSERARALMVHRVRRLDHLLISSIGIFHILLINHLLFRQIVRVRRRLVGRWALHWRLLVPGVLLSRLRVLATMLSSILLSLLDALEPLIHQRVSHDEGTPLLVLKLLLQQVKASIIIVVILFILFLILLFARCATAFLLLAGCLLTGWSLVLLLKSVQMAEHWIHAGHQVLLLRVAGLRLLNGVCGIPLLLASLQPARASRNILCVLLSSQSLQGLVQILELLILLFSQLGVVFLTPVCVLLRERLLAA